MKAKKIVLAIGMMILPAFPAFSADSTFEGDIGATGMLTNVQGNKAKFNEYRDLTDGVYGNVRLKYDSDNFFARGKAEDMGYDTQNYRVEGGMYGVFKGYLDYREIPHNFTFDAKTPFGGAGSNNLTGAANTNINSWHSFDYSIRRRTYGAGFSLDLLKPFFFDVSYARESKTGTYPTGVGQSGGGGTSLEIPVPVDYTTNTLNVQGGYARKPFFAAVNVMYQNFDDANSLLSFTNPSGPAGNRDNVTLPPDNQYYKVAFKGSVDLPLNSKFNVNLATSKTTSEANLLSYYVRTTVVPITLSDTSFNGRIETQNYNFVLTSHPVSFLLGKIYYKYYDRQNKSDQIITRDSGFAGGAPFTNPQFDYIKNNLGINLEWLLPARFQLGTSYDWQKINRARGDLPETIDNKYSVDLKWKGLDFMTPKIGYEFLQRTADTGVLAKESATDQITENAIAPYLTRFDGAPLNRDTFKAGLDIYPLSNVTLGIGYKYIHSNYKETILGLKSSRTHDVGLDAGYTFEKIAQINAYFDMEITKDDQVQRNFSTATAANPNGAQSTANYNWELRMKDNSYAWGVNSEIYVVPRKVTLILQYDNITSNGFQDFTYLTAIPAGRSNLDDIGNWDDYRLTSYVAKIRYTPTKKYAITAGYAYEHYKYTDAQYNNYQYVQDATNYLTGAYANPSYQAHIMFIALNYRF